MEETINLIIGCVIILGCFIVIYLLDPSRKTRRKATRSEEPVWLIPANVLEVCFASVGLKFVSNSRISKTMRDKGWSSQTWQNEVIGARLQNFPKDVTDRTRKELIDSRVVDVLAIIFGPNKDGESVCLRYELAVVRYEEWEEAPGKRVRTITNIWPNEEVSQRTNPCTELFDSVANQDSGLIYH